MDFSGITTGYDDFINGGAKTVNTAFKRYMNLHKSYYNKYSGKSKQLYKPTPQPKMNPAAFTYTPVIASTPEQLQAQRLKEALLKANSFLNPKLKG